MRRVTETGPDKGRQGVWGVEDLRERPAPIAGAGAPVTAWMSRTTAITLSGGGSTQFVSAYDFGDTQDASILELDETNGLIIQHAPGIVIAGLRVQLTVAAGPMYCRINRPDDNDNVPIGTDHFKSQDTVNQNGNFSDFAWDFLPVTPSSPGDYAFSATISQSSGTNRNTNIITLGVTLWPL